MSLLTCEHFTESNSSSSPLTDPSSLYITTSVTCDGDISRRQLSDSTPTHCAGVFPFTAGRYKDSDSGAIWAPWAGLSSQTCADGVFSIHHESEGYGGPEGSKAVQL
ncbi:hypothetical protein INR49_011546 [Caranx melampygus]|nr:hypothetical protein INR49_011546 [Caranx melampygus]